VKLKLFLRAVAAPDARWLFLKLLAIGFIMPPAWVLLVVGMVEIWGECPESTGKGETSNAEHRTLNIEGGGARPAVTVLCQLKIMADILKSLTPKRAKVEGWLAAGRSGRVVLHLAAAVAGGAWGWHWAGIAREIWRS